MKKVLPVALLVFTALSSNAKTEKYPYFCMINGFHNLASQLRIEIEWGKQVGIANIRDEKG